MATQLEPTTVKVYPALLAAAIKAEMSSHARVYLLAQARDRDGRGLLDVAEIRDLLTAKDSDWRICGKRRLRDILNDGEGILWHRYTRDRIWLNGPARVAEALDCGRLRGMPAELPIAALLDGLAATKAAFLASWHAGREDAEGNSTPISQATIRDITGISPATQRRYHKIAGVKVQHNIAISDMTWREHMSDAAYERGRGVFRFIDRRGKRGKRGRGYVAWHLPATYTSPCSQTPKGRLRKINRQIDLVISTTRGNSREINRLYFLKGSAAIKAHSKQPDDDHYYLRKPSLISDVTQVWEAL